jgi:argininosuccinate lyase
MTIRPEQEDCHTALEHALTAQLGATVRRIHLARSRNDQVATALRLLMRSRLLDLGQALHGCARAFLDLARTWEHSPLPGYTHLRRAMPSTWGMWGAAFAEGLLEELEALPAVWARLDRCPLGPRPASVRRSGWTGSGRRPCSASAGSRPARWTS